MKKKILVLVMSLLLLSGCNKFKGTWCRSTEVFGTIIVTKTGVTDKQISNIENKIKEFGNYKSYDIIDSIEKGNTSITTYFTENAKATELVELVKNLDGVDKVEKKSFIVTSEKLEVKGKKQFIYSTNLDNVDALVEKGEYSLNDDGTLSIYGDRTFYLKDKFVCTDVDCNNILRKKSKTNTCK